MRIKSIIVSIAAAAATLYGGIACAEYQDHRTDPNLANVEAAFKGATVEDAVSILVPMDWTVTYQTPAIRSMKISSNGQGSWPRLLEQGLRTVGLGMAINMETRSIAILQGPPVMTAAAPAVAPAAAPAKPAPAAAAPVAGAIRTITAPIATRAETSGVPAATILAVQQAARAAQAAAAQATAVPAAAAQPVAMKPAIAVAPRVYTVRASDGSISRTVQRWADESSMQLIWEDADVDYPVRAESEFSSDITSALTDLLTVTHNGRTPLRACIHPNKPHALIRVIRRADKCDLTEAL